MFPEKISPDQDASLFISTDTTLYHIVTLCVLLSGFKSGSKGTAPCSMVTTIARSTSESYGVENMAETFGLFDKVLDIVRHK